MPKKPKKPKVNKALAALRKDKVVVDAKYFDAVLQMHGETSDFVAGNSTPLSALQTLAKLDKICDKAYAEPISLEEFEEECARLSGETQTPPGVPPVY